MDKKNDTTINRWRFVLSLALLISFWFLGFRLAAKTGLIRDESYFNNDLIRMYKGKPFIENNGEVRELTKKYRPPFSYSRVQMFWWTLVILSCYLIFFGLTGTLLPLNATTVILLGLGAIVLAAGKLIDKNQIRDSSIPLGSRSQDRNYSNDFFINILSDEKGVSLHRFQAIVFNVVFGIGFIGSFFKNIADKQYPFIEFNEWQFALLGISASAFLALKAGENKDVQNNQDNLANKRVEDPLTTSSIIELEESNSGQHDR